MVSSSNSELFLLAALVVTSKTIDLEKLQPMDLHILKMFMLIGMFVLILCVEDGPGSASSIICFIWLLILLLHQDTVLSQGARTLLIWWMNTPGLYITSVCHRVSIMWLLNVKCF